MSQDDAQIRALLRQASWRLYELWAAFRDDMAYGVAANTLALHKQCQKLLGIGAAGERQTSDVRA